MIREKIVLIFCLALIVGSQLCFADEAEMAPTSQGIVNPSEQMSEQVTPVEVVVESYDQPYEQVAPVAVMINPSGQSREQAAPTAVMVELPEQSYEQAATEAAAVEPLEQSYEQAAPEAVEMESMRQLEIAPEIKSAQSLREVKASLVEAVQPKQEFKALSPSATIIFGSREMSSPTVIRQEPLYREIKAVPSAVMTMGSESVKKTLPPMNVAVLSAKESGPQSMKVISAEAVQATQKK